jgi:hypothetical protein
MDRPTSLVLLEYALNAAWLMVPLIPATLIYLLFPKTRVVAVGPFQGFRLNLSGAFAAYFALLVLTWPILEEQNASLRSLFRPIWTISGNIEVLDSNGNKIPVNEHMANVTFDNPNPIIIQRSGHFLMRVPEVDNQIPEVHIVYKGYGEVTLPPVAFNGSTWVVEGDEKNVDVKTREKEIVLSGPPLQIANFCKGSCEEEDSSH